MRNNTFNSQPDVHMKQAKSRLKIFLAGRQVTQGHVMLTAMSISICKIHGNLYQEVIFSTTQSKTKHDERQEGN